MQSKGSPWFYLPLFVLLVGPTTTVGTASSGAGASSTTSSPRRSPPQLSPLIIHGYKFFDSKTGQEVVIRGIDYYPRPNHGDLNQNSIDYFTIEHSNIWERDIPFLKQLGVNAVRLYAVDPDANHDAFMCALAQAGMYAIVALAHDCPTCAITKDQAPDCYPSELKQQGQQVIQTFVKYANTLAFSAGNEVNHYTPNNVGPQWNAPCQKKFIHDMRQYIQSTCINSFPRIIPIGLISADNDRQVLAQYYNCRETQQDDDSDAYEVADWYGLNSYVFCNGKVSTYNASLGLKELAQSFQELNYSIPVLLTEFGCLSETFPTINNYPGQRTFLQAKWLQTESHLHEQFAGGLAFEYSMELENAKSASPYPFTTFGKQAYGIGYFEPEECDDITISCNYHPFPAFDMLRDAYIVSNTEIVTLVNVNNFSIPANRQNRSTCPDQFPRLDSFDWVVDHYPDVPCPNRRSNQLFVCPANYKVLLETNQESTLSQRQFLKVLTAVIGTVALAILYLIVSKKGWSISRDDDRTPISTVKVSEKYTDGNLRNNSNRSEKDEESVSLMSCIQYNRSNSDHGVDPGSSYYQTIESPEVSSNNLEMLSGRK